jgi:hypothetical protein
MVSCVVLKNHLRTLPKAAAIGRMHKMAKRPKISGFCCCAVEKVIMVGSVVSVATTWMMGVDGKSAWNELHLLVLLSFVGSSRTNPCDHILIAFKRVALIESVVCGNNYLERYIQYYDDASSTTRSETCWKIILNFTDPAIQLGSIGNPYGPVLMILNRMKGMCGVSVFSSSQGNWMRIWPRIQLQGSSSGCGAEKRMTQWMTAAPHHLRSRFFV